MTKKILYFLCLPLLLTGCGHDDKAYQDQAKLYDDIRTSNNPSSMFRIAETMRKSGNYETATNLYQQVLQIEPNRVEAYIGLSQCLRYSGRSEAALETLKVIPQGSQTKDYYKELGNVYTTRQQPKACIQSFMTAYQADPKDLGTLNGLGVCHDLAGQHEEAQEWYRTAIELAPAHEKLRSNLGLSLSLSGKVQEAIDILKPIVNGNDATQRDRQNLAIAYGLAGDMDAAAKLFAQDLDENAVRTNLAFLHKLTKSQALMAKRPTTTQLRDAFENGLLQQEKGTPGPAKEAKQASTNSAIASPKSAEKTSTAIASPAQTLSVKKTNLSQAAYTPSAQESWKDSKMKVTQIPLPQSKTGETNTPLVAITRATEVVEQGNSDPAKNNPTEPDIAEDVIPEPGPITTDLSYSTSKSESLVDAHETTGQEKGSETVLNKGLY